MRNITELFSRRTAPLFGEIALRVPGALRWLINIVFMAIMAVMAVVMLMLTAAAVVVMAVLVMVVVFVSAVLLRTEDGHAVLNAVADCLHLFGNVGGFVLKKQLLCRKVEADVAKALRFGDFCLDLRRAVGAIEIIQNQCVSHTITPKCDPCPSR